MEVIETKLEEAEVGSVLLARHENPLGIGETKTLDVTTKYVDALVIDIQASNACTLEVLRMPAWGVEGESSGVVSVPAGSPKCYTWSQPQCLGMRVKITNTSGAPMTSFFLYVRGAA